jgi:hypothetical protein
VNAGSAPSMTILANGNVGIGTTNPSQRLHIRGTTSAMIRVDTNNSAVGEVSGIEFGIPAFSSLQSAKITSTALDGDKNDLKFYTRNGTAFNALNYMTLTSGGDLQMIAQNGVTLADTEQRIITNGSTISAVFGGDTMINNYWGVAININAGGHGDNNNANATKIAQTSSFTINTRTSSSTTGFDKTLFIVRNSGQLNFANDIWHKAIDNTNRLYFANNATTYFGSPTGVYVFRSSTDTNTVSINNSGLLSCSSLLVSDRFLTVTSSFNFVSGTTYVCNFTLTAFQALMRGRTYLADCQVSQSGAPTATCYGFSQIINNYTTNILQKNIFIPSNTLVSWYNSSGAVTWFDSLNLYTYGTSLPALTATLRLSVIG